MATESLIDRAITEPLSLHRILLRAIKFFVEEAQYHRYGQANVFDDVHDRLQWAHAKGDDFLHCWFFLVFYVNFPEFRVFVNSVETVAYPGTTEVYLSFLYDALGQTMQDVSMAPFEQSNIVELTTKFRVALRVYAAHRPATFLAFPDFNPKAFIDTSDNVKAFPQRYLSTYEDNKLRADSLKRVNAKLRQHAPDSAQWRSIADTIARQQTVLQHMTVYPDGHRVKRRRVIESETATLIAAEQALNEYGGPAFEFEEEQTGFV